MAAAPARHRVERVAGRAGRVVVAHVVEGAVPRWVVVLHGIADSGRLVEYAARQAAAVGVGLVGVNRPGYGATTPAVVGMDVALDDVRQVARHLGLERYSVLGLSGGGAFAAALAATTPAVDALGVVAGIAPWREVEPDRASWDADEVAVADLVASGHHDEAAAIVRDGCATAFAPLLAGTDDAVAAAVLPAWLTDDGDRACLVASLREALTTFDGVVYDNLTLDAVPTWHPDDVAQPTFVWQGDADETVALANAAWFAERIPRARLTVLEGLGHGSTVLGRFDECVRTLVDAAS